jgi:putative DNA primase/helicase
MQDPLRGFRQPKIKELELLNGKDDIRSRTLDWLWHGRLLRGALELISGIPDIGKSQAQISLIASATTRNPWPDGTNICEPCNVIMLTAEDTLDQIIKPRWLAAGADSSRITIIKCIKEDDKGRQFLLSEDLDMLEKAVEKVGDVGLVTIDPITSYMGKIDSHKATDVRSQLGPLKDLAEKLNIAFSAITHPAKNAGQKAIDFFIGSQAFIAAARIGHVCVPEVDADGNQTGRILFTSVRHAASERMPTLAYRVEAVTATDPDNPFLKLPISRVVWGTDPVDVTADEAVASMAPKGKRETKRKAINDFLNEILKDGKPVPSTTIYEEGKKRGFSEDQLKRASEPFSGGGTIKAEKTKDGWFWVLVPF